MDKKILSRIFSATSVAIFIHINPDADAVGSAVAMKLALERKGIEVALFSENSITDQLMSIKMADCFNTTPIKSFDVGLILDCAEIARIGSNMSKVLSNCERIALIDHHEKCNLSGVKWHYIDEKAASATQVLYYLLKEHDSSIIDKDIAEVLYAGVLTDSGGFLFSNVTDKTMSMVADLYTYGINAPKIATQLMRDVKKSVFDLQIEALKNARFFDNDSIGIIVLTKELFQKTNTTEQDTSNLVNRIVDIKEVKIAISISEISSNAYKVSIRSTGSNYALCLARCFGGGGHKEASGCRVYGYIDDCIAKLVGAARDILAND